jgi:hypothetical protein
MHLTIALKIIFFIFLCNLSNSTRLLKLASTYKKEIPNIAKIIVVKKINDDRFVLMFLTRIEPEKENLQTIVMRIVMLTNEKPNWLFLCICLILAVIIGYLIFVIISKNKKAEYYKKLDKWRKSKPK